MRQVKAKAIRRVLSGLEEKAFTKKQAKRRYGDWSIGELRKLAKALDAPVLSFKRID